MKTIFEFKTLTDFTDYFCDEATCVAHFTESRFRNGEYCPHCKHDKIYKCANGKRYQCAKCKQDFTIRTKTVFGESKLPLRKWYMAIYLLATSNKGISSVQLAKQVGVTQKTGWFIDHRVRSAMKQNKGNLFGTFEIDETYIGGLEKNKRASKRTAGTQGRSPKVKTPVVGMVQRGGEVRTQVVERVTMQTVENQIKDNAAKGSQIYSDDFLSYARIGKMFPHKAVGHGRGEYVNGDCHTNGIESFWALFKRGYHGIYHFMSKKHLQKYVDEFTFRFNRRNGEMQGIFSDVLNRVTDSPQLSYKTLIEKTA
jgi:transposase-like protein